VVTEGHVNGGFFVFERGMLDYLSTEESCALEGGPLERLARDGQLRMFAHEGYWQCMDTQRDLTHLNQLWASGSPPWKTWADDR
jgi:glucose-1-phosphate cytidylyltransferase